MNKTKLTELGWLCLSITVVLAVIALMSIAGAIEGGM
jgi:hypothetical protein